MLAISFLSFRQKYIPRGRLQIQIRFSLNTNPIFSAPVEVGEVGAGPADCRRVDNGSHLQEIVHQQPVEKGLVPSEQQIMTNPICSHNKSDLSLNCYLSCTDCSTFHFRMLSGLTPLLMISSLGSWSACQGCAEADAQKPDLRGPGGPALPVLSHQHLLLLGHLQPAVEGRERRGRREGSKHPNGGERLSKV
jgi:hypothetical protein